MQQLDSVPGLLLLRGVLSKTRKQKKAKLASFTICLYHTANNGL